MAKSSVLLIGCGRMGRGIVRMLLLEQKRQHFPFDIWIFDPYQDAENLCNKEVHKSKIQGKIRALRELLSKSELTQINQLQQTTELEPGAIEKASTLISRSLKQVQPHLIINAATYFAQQIYLPLARILGCDYVDLGQGLPSMDDLKVLDAELSNNQEGVRIIQESGLAPGLANILAVSMYEKALNDTTKNKVYSVQMRVGGLPQHSRKGGKLHYGPTFSPEGLLFEYEKIAYGLRNNQLVTSHTFSNYEYWESPSDIPLPFGIAPFIITNPQIKHILTQRLENEFFQWENDELLLKNLQARPTADGTSRMCFDEKYQKTVYHLEYKTLRYFPHYETWKELQEKGQLGSILAHWKQQMNNIQFSGFPDLVLMRVWAKATKTSKPHTVELIALHDEIPVGSPTGFTAMQHLTGWPTVLIALALLQNPPDVKSMSKFRLFRSPNSTTAFGRTIEDILCKGGIIAPFELIDGLPFFEELTKTDRISLCQPTLTST